MKNSHMLALILAALLPAAAQQVGVVPVQAAPGDEVQLTLPDGRVNDLGRVAAVYVGSRSAVAQRSGAPNVWTFTVPENGLPGSQPVRFAPQKGTGIDAWLEVLPPVKPPKRAASDGSAWPGTAFEGLTLAAHTPDLLVVASKERITTDESLRASLRKGLEFQKRNISQTLPKSLFEPPGNLPELLNSLKINRYTPLKGSGLVNFPRPVQVLPGDRLPAPNLPREYLQTLTNKQLADLSKLPAGASISLNRLGLPQLIVVRPLLSSRKLFDQVYVLPPPPTSPLEPAVTLEAVPGQDSYLCGQYLYQVHVGDLRIRLGGAGQITDAFARAGLPTDPSDYGYPNGNAQATGQPPASGPYGRTQAALVSTGVFDEEDGKLIRLNARDAGRGVRIFIIDTGGPAYTDANGKKNGGDDATYRVKGSTRLKQGHGTIVGHLAASDSHGMAPGALVTHLDACGERERCDGIQVLRFLCKAARAAASDKASPVVVNLSLNTPVSSPLMYLAVHDLLNAGATLVTSYGNKDRCVSSPAQEELEFADYCTAYPADWAGLVRLGMPQPAKPLLPPLLARQTSRGLRENRAFYSVGAREPAVIANVNRKPQVDVGVAVTVPSRPNTYAPGLYDLKLGKLSEYWGTSFAAPIVTGLIAEELARTLPTANRVPSPQKCPSWPYTLPPEEVMTWRPCE